VAHNTVLNPGLSSGLTFSFVVFARHLDNFIMTQKFQPVYRDFAVKTIL
jgi:hypothetical protein